MSSFCTSDLASLDRSLAGLRDSLGQLRAAKAVNITEVTEQLRRAVNSSGIVRELVLSELPEASWESRVELDTLVGEIQKILDARALEQLRARLLDLATELDRGSIVHRRAHRVNELNQLRDEAVTELRSRAGLKGALPTLPGPGAYQWISWACDLKEPEDAEYLQTLRNGFPRLDDFIANLEPNLWVGGELPAVGVLLGTDKPAGTTPPGRPLLERKMLEEPAAPSGPSRGGKDGFDPRYVKVLDPRVSERPAVKQSQPAAAARFETPAVRYDAPNLKSALGSLDHSLALLQESLVELGAARPVDVTEAIVQLKRASEYARIVRELVWAELPEAAWEDRRGLDALIAEIQQIVEARAREQLRSRLLALATELESGSIVHRRANRVSELNRLRANAIDELRSEAGSEGAIQTLPGPPADQWIAWACRLEEPQDTESLQTLRDGFPHLDDFVANLEPNMWVAAKPPAPEVPPEPEKPAAKTPPGPRLVEKTPDEPRVSSAPVQPALEAAKSDGGREDPGFSNLVDRLRRKRPQPTSPAEEEVQPTRAEEHAPPVESRRPARPPVEAPPPPPPVDSSRPAESRIADSPREAAAAPETAADVTAHVEPRGLGWLSSPAGMGSTALLLLLAILGVMLWAARRSHTGITTVKAVESKAPDQPLSSPVGNGIVQPVMSTEPLQATTPLTATADPSKPQGQIAAPKPQEQSATPKPKDQNAAPKPQELSSFAKTLAKIKQGSDSAALNPPSAAPSNTATAKKEQAAPPAAPPLTSGAANGGNSIVQNIPVAVSTTTDRPGAAAQQPAVPQATTPAPQPTTTAALQPPPSAPPPRTSEQPQKVRVSSGVAQGLLLHQVAPQYPQLARQTRVQGTVVLQAVIGKDGYVQSLKALSGPTLLVPAAVDAVRRWRYKPYQLNGEPVEADTQINVKFTLPNE